MVDGRDVRACGESDGEFVVAGREAAVVFEGVNAAFDGVPVLVLGGVEGWWSAATGSASVSVSGLVGGGRDGGADAVSGEPVAVGSGGVRALTPDLGHA